MRRCRRRVILARGQIAAQTSSRAPKASAIPRTADGKPDLQGIWSNATLTLKSTLLRRKPPNARRRGSRPIETGVAPRRKRMWVAHIGWLI